MKDTWESGDPYEYYVGRWSRSVAREFLQWLAPDPRLRWLDVGCGTGALSEAVLMQCKPREVTSVDPSEGFLSSARARLGDRALLKLGHATELPLEDASVDMTVSGLVLNFVSEPAQGLLEMKRVTSTGGTVAAYVWDYAGKMELMRRFWDAAVALDPNAAVLDEAARFPICNPDALRRPFQQAGLTDITVTSIDVETRFRDFDDYWHPFLGGQGPAPTYCMSLDETSRAALRDAICQRLPIEDDGSISLIARAWAIRGRVRA